MPPKRKVTTTTTDNKVIVDDNKESVVETKNKRSSTKKSTIKKTEAVVDTNKKQKVKSCNSFAQLVDSQNKSESIESSDELTQSLEKLTLQSTDFSNENNTNKDQDSLINETTDINCIVQSAVKSVNEKINNSNLYLYDDIMKYIDPHVMIDKKDQQILIKNLSN